MKKFFRRLYRELIVVMNRDGFIGPDGCWWDIPKKRRR